MSNSSSRRFPVTVTQLPVTRCEICQRTVAYRPGTLSEALTEHYRRAHPEALGRPAPVGIVGSCLEPAAWQVGPSRSRSVTSWPACGSNSWLLRHKLASPLIFDP
jgi:hypothetical protein